MTFSSPLGESQMCPSSPDSTQLSVKFGEWASSETLPTNNHCSFHLSLGGWSLSHNLFTLYNICMTKSMTNSF